LFLPFPDVSFDLASFSFQVPIWLAAKQAAAAKKKNARVNTVIFVFMWPMKSGF
jgi:hypothetical protein